MKKLISNNFKMMKYVIKFCPQQIPIIVFDSILQSIQSILGVLMLKYVIDMVNDNKNFCNLLIFILLLSSINIIIMVIHIWIRQKVIPVNSQMIIGKMQIVLFEKAASLDVECYENTVYYNRLMTAREQAVTRILGILDSFSTLVSSLFSISAFIALIATMEPIIIVISILSVGVSFFLNTRAVKVQSIFYKKKIPIEREMNYMERVSSQVEFAKELRMYMGFSQLVKKRFNKKMQELMSLMKYYSSKYIKIINLQNFVNQFFNSGVIIYLTYRTLMNLISFGDFMALANCNQQLTSQLTSLIAVVPELYEHAIYIENFLEFMEYESRIKSGVKKIDNLKKIDIKFEKVSFMYSNTDKMILKNINLTINQGEKIAIVGRNGAGKSTLVKLLNRLYDPTSGSIYLQGVKYQDYDINSIRNSFGTFFQDFQIFAVSIAENILMSESCDTDQEKKRIKEALRFVGIEEKVMRLKNGIYSEMTREFDDDGIIFSGGEYQKIAIARVYEKESRIMIFDEPSSALDPIAEKELFDKMMELADGKTVIFISHRLSNITNVDKIVYIEEGMIKEIGTHSELMKKNGLYAKMYRIQAERYLIDY